jgi:hypothetical protein
MKNARIHTNNKVRETTKSGRRIQMEKHQLATQEANHKKKKKKKNEESQPPVMLFNA